MADLRILVVSDNPLARMGLAALLAGQPGLAVVGQSSSADLMADADAFLPDAIVWDWGWSPAPERAADLRALGIPALALLSSPQQAAEARAAGARGLLLGSFSPEKLAAALIAAGEGLAIFDPALVEALLPAADQPDAPAEALTGREIEVLQLLAEGLPNKTIAARLGITDHTVKFHVNAIMGKLNAQSRTEAVVRATRLGLIIL
jgi:DNA-binding NarL/FixJ family response regulator